MAEAEAAEAVAAVEVAGKEHAPKLAVQAAATTTRRGQRGATPTLTATPVATSSRWDTAVRTVGSRTIRGTKRM